METKNLVIGEDGQAYVEERTLTPVVNVAAMLRTLTDSLAFRLPVLTPDTTLVYSNGDFTLFRLITSLKLHCVWATNEVEEGRKRVEYMYPTFGRDNQEMSMDTSAYCWIPPKDMAVFFIATHLGSCGGKLMDPNKTNFRYRQASASLNGKAGLIVVDLKTRALHRLPVPNVYENGVLCTGDLQAMDGWAMTRAESLFGSWESNRWNSDLIEHTNHGYKKLIRLDPKTGKTLPPADNLDWRQLCPKISIGNWLPDNILQLGLEGL